MARHLFCFPGLCASVALALISTAAVGQTVPAATQVIMEGFPDVVRAGIELRDQQIAAAASNVGSVPFHLIVPSLNRWTPGGVVRVAFNGGNPDLHSKIEAAAQEWTKPGIANLQLQFRDASGQFNSWGAQDINYKAEIRIAFATGNQAGGFWSHVGKDSIDQSLSGGQPGEASMNFDSFDQKLPPDWRAIVIHEFGHAIGFQHEHQNPIGGCDFRFEDDPGYVQTKDAAGWFTTDANGRRPGLYTYLGGKSNFWPRNKVDFNLRAIPVSSAYLVGTFDKTSIMKYFFGAFMFIKGDKSPCFTATENLVLSDQDKVGAHEAYKSDVVANAALMIQRKQLLKELLASPSLSNALSANIKTNLNALQ